MVTCNKMQKKHVLKIDTGGQIVHAFESARGLNIEGSIDESKSFVDQFMTAQLISEYFSLTRTKCDTSDETSVAMESINKLRVNISAGVSSYLISEIEKALSEKIEKNNSNGQLAQFTKTSKFTRLPRYLTINFIRFQWKAADKVHAKILKRVEFPFELDLFKFATNNLQEKMKVARDNIIQHAKSDAKKNAKLPENSPPPKDKSAFDPDQIEILTTLGVDVELALDPGCNPSGMYDLAAGNLN